MSVNLVQNLLNAIYAAFVNSPALVAAFPGGMRSSIADENAKMPYLVYHPPIGGQSANVYGSLQNQQPEIQFTAVAPLDSTAGNLLTLVLAAYLGDNGDGVILPLVGGGSITNIWTAHAPIYSNLGRTASIADDPNQNDVWACSTTIHYVLSP